MSSPPVSSTPALSADAAGCDDSEWDLIISPQHGLMNANFRELWEYRDLLFMFVMSDVITVYKQTILGPIWFLAQPLMTMLVFVVVFGNIAGISTDGVPKPLFYLSGIVIWNFFAESFNRTALSFTAYSHIFGKVYFPRLIVPLALVLSSLLKFCLQFLLFLSFYAYFYLTGAQLHPNIWLLLAPLTVLMMGCLGLGFGIIFSSLTTKYRDLVFLLQFGLQLAMYVTPIIYPMSLLEGHVRNVLWWNPAAHFVETFRFAFTGEGLFSLSGLAYACLFSIGMLVTGVLIFSRAERTFIDTI